MIRQQGSAFNPAAVNIIGGNIVATSITATGPLTPNATIGVIGTTGANNANVGSVGELIFSTVSLGAAIGLTTTVTTNVTSISLTSGDWDVSSCINFNVSGATGTLFQGGPSLATATLPTQPGGSGLGPDALASFPVPITGLTGDLTLDSGPVRLTTAATTVVFLPANAVFSIGTVTVFGTIRARRMR